MKFLDKPPRIKLTPEQFETEVKALLDKLGGRLADYESRHRELMDGTDGEYEIDVTVRFSALGARFLVLIECKHHKNPVKRELVQALHSKLLSVGAQKAMLFSTTTFQSGALEFAEAHGIALIRLTDGGSCYFTRSAEGVTCPPPWADIEPIVGWLIRGNTYSRISTRDVSALEEFLQEGDDCARCSGETEG